MVTYPLERPARQLVPLEDGFWVHTSDSAWNSIFYNPATGATRPYDPEVGRDNHIPKPFWLNEELDTAVVWWSHTQELSALFPHGSNKQVVIRIQSKYTLLTVVPDGWEAARGGLRPAVSLDGLTGAVVIERVANDRIFHQLVVFDLP